MSDDEKLGKILLVDDDVFFLKTYEKFLSKHYIIRSAESGKEGLEILAKGFQPDVIISDQYMPSMRGDEFLAKSMSIVPEAIRVVVTSSDDSAEIIRCINNGHCYMFIRKPVDTLSFVHSVKNAMSHRLNIRRRNIEIKKLQAEIAALKQRLEISSKGKSRTNLDSDLNNVDYKSLIAALTLFNYGYNKYFFRNFERNVLNIATAIATELNLSDKELEKVKSATMLSTSFWGTLPQSILENDFFYEDIESEKLEFLKEHFIKYVNVLNSLNIFNDYAPIVSQIFERFDGSGYPRALQHNSLERYSQIISIAIFYEYLVYKLTSEEIEQAKTNVSICQDYIHSVHRHNNALEFLKLKSKWYSYEVYSAFSAVVKRKRTESIFPHNNNLYLNWQSLKIHSTTEEISLISKGASQDNYDLSPVETAKVEITVFLPPKKLETGMRVAESIRTKSGILVVRDGTILDSKIIKNLNQLESNAMLDSDIAIITYQDKALANEG